MADPLQCGIHHVLEMAGGSVDAHGHPHMYKHSLLRYYPQVFYTVGAHRDIKKSRLDV